MSEVKTTLDELTSLSNDIWDVRKTETTYNHNLNAIYTRINDIIDNYDEYQQFCDNLLLEMRRHDKDKGDSWKTIPYPELKKLALKAIWEIVTPDNIFVEWNPDQLIDIVCFLAMMHVRRDENNE